MLPEKTCPRCGCTYMHTATQCSDCRVALVLGDELEEEATRELPPATELTAVRISSVTWARSFSEVLSEAGIPHRIDSPTHGGHSAPRMRRRSEDGSVAIFVRPGDREAALALDAEFAQSQIPDLPEPMTTTALDSPSEGCPACGSPIQLDAAECPGCGLYLGEAE